MDEQTLQAKIGAAVDNWFNSEIHGSPVSRNTEAYNHPRRALDVLAEAPIRRARRGRLA